MNALFVLTLGLFYTMLLHWGFRHLPGERWQILATLPVRKDASGQWQGINITAYGLITASAYAISVLTLFVLLSAIGVPLLTLMVLAAALLAVVAPASRLVARVVEKKRYTFTIGGATFVGIVVSPWAILATNAVGDTPIPLIPTLAAFAVVYTFGEGIGRLACISWGCCYGKPLAACHPLLQQAFHRRHFVFEGKLKKIAWEGRMDGLKVVPIQAITCVIDVATGLAATSLFLAGRFAPALLLALGVTQIWRVLSETLRADYRGGDQAQGAVPARSFSVYQLLALAGLVYAAAVVAFAPPAPLSAPDIARGVHALWQPGVIVFVQAVWIAALIYAGRSMVTSGVISIRLHEDRL